MQTEKTTGRISNQDWARLVVLSLLWSGSFLFISLALRELPPFVIVVARLGLGALILLAYVRATGRSIPGDLASWRAVTGMGIINNILPFSLFTFAQTVVPAGSAAIVNAMTPVMTVIVLHLATPDEKLTPGKAIGVTLGFLGVALLIGPDALGGLNASVLGMLACLAATLCYALSALQGRKVQALVSDPVVSAACMLTASSLVMLPFVLWLHPPTHFTMPGLNTVLAVLGLSLLSTSLAYVIFYKIMRSAGSSNLMLVTFMIPVSALLLGAIVLGEVITLPAIGGMVLIGCGLAAIDGRLMRRFSRA